MKITLIVGNGFDLGLGLKTSYHDFIQRYTEKPVADDLYDPEMVLKEKISRDPTTWEDAEMAFARLDFSNMFKQSKDIRRIFLEMLTKFQCSLVRYLKGEESRVLDDRPFSFKTEFIAKIVQSLIKGEPPERRREDIKKLCSEAVELNCINLNYTNTFDRMFNLEKPEMAEVVFSPNLCSICSVGKVLHVHGTLGGNDTIFGVSDVGQIKDDVVRRLCLLTGGTFIKHRQDSEYGAGNYDVALNLVQKSDWLVIFGTSMGESDSYLWSTIIARLQLNKNLRVFIFKYSQKPRTIESKNDWIMLQYDGREMFLHSYKDKNDEVEMRSLEPCLKRVTIMNDGPYEGLDGANHLGDPWSLNEFATKLSLRI